MFIIWQLAHEILADYGWPLSVSPSAAGTVDNTWYFEKRQREITQPVETVPIARRSQLYVKTKLVVTALILK